MSMFSPALKRFAAMAACAVLAFGSVSCSEDDPDPTPTPNNTLTGTIRIRTTWGASGGDIDVFLSGPSVVNPGSRYLVYYGNATNTGENASHSGDVTSGPGEETITLVLNRDGVYRHTVEPSPRTTAGLTTIRNAPVTVEILNENNQVVRGWVSNQIALPAGGFTTENSWRPFAIQVTNGVGSILDDAANAGWRTYSGTSDYTNAAKGKPAVSAEAAAQY